MSGTTPGGLPYPDPTDPVADGATAIRALAEALDARFQRIMGRAQTLAQNLTSGNTQSILTMSLIEATGVTFTANGFTITKAGMYVISGDLTLSSSTTGGASQLSAMVNESVASSVFSVVGMTTRTNRMQVAAVKQLGVGDVVTLRAYQESGSTMALGGGSGRLHVARIPE